MFSLIGSLRGGLRNLHDLPARLARPVQDGQIAWAMYLSDDSAFSGQRGVYSTAFAIQLLSGSVRCGTDDVARQIAGGMRYLKAQYLAAEAAARGEHLDSKQARKLQEVGHTDSALVMKCVAILDAANSVAEIRGRHRDYGAVLDDCEEVLVEIGQRLKQASVERQVEGNRQIMRGWPWHLISPDSPLDVIPTVSALTALTHPSIRSSRRYLDDVAPVLNYLSAMLDREDVTEVHKAMILRAVDTLRKRMSELDVRDVVSKAIGYVKHSLPDLDRVPWQEVLHYTVPAAQQPAEHSHYKPWIWICPRIEMAEALLISGEQSAETKVAETAALLAGNLRQHGGTVRFLSSQPPALLANFRAAAFLHHYSTTRLDTVVGQARYCGAYARVRVVHFVTKYPWLVPATFLALLWPYMVTSEVPWNHLTGWSDLRALLPQIGSAVWRGRLVWVVVLICILAFAKGPLVNRVWVFVQTLLVAIGLGLVVEFLAR